MKIIKKNIDSKSGGGFVVLQANEDDDIYCIFNVITKGDSVTAKTVRNVSSYFQ